MDFQSSDPISPSCYVKNNSHRAPARTANITSNDINERSSPSYNPSSPRYAPELNDTNGPLPISPHVNVPNAHSFNHQPPPLPPRVKKKNPIEFSHSQMRQAKDAPLLLPRDKSPPPLPPRYAQVGVNSYNNNSNNNNNNNVETFNHLVSLKCELRWHSLRLKLGNYFQREESMHIQHMTQLTTPETSTIMQRRNSEALANNKEGSSTATTPKSLNSSFEAKTSPGPIGKKQK